MKTLSFTKLISIAILILSQPLNLLAQPPALLVKDADQKKSEPLEVTKLETSVVVTGNTAETKMTLTFANNTDRVLEGELVFPLNQGTTISGYALEVNGKMREGVVVEKNFARSAYEDVIRQEIDPGLVEWTKGNNFRTRIYPIPAKGTKKVSISYEETLSDSLKDAKMLAYRLPLAFQKMIADFQLNIKVVKPSGDKKIIVENNAGLNLELKDEKSWNLRAKEKNFLANKTLVLKIPKESLPSAISYKSKDGNHYLYITDHKIEPGKTTAREVPKNIKLIWDASHSGAERDTEKELALIKRYISQAGVESVELEVLRNVITKKGVFSTEKAGIEKLVQTINSLRYDGATRLGEIDFSNATEDAVLLVSDGIVTHGSADSLRNDKLKIPVFTFHCAQSAEHALLKSIALRSGGAYINLTRNDMETAYKSLTQQAFSLVSVTGKGIKEVYPSIATPVSGAMSVAALTNEDVTEVTLNYGVAGKIVTKHTFEINAETEDHDTASVARLWAQKKLAELELDPKKHEDKIVELAKKHKIVTRYTSLLVLDRLEDYVRYAIAPPEPELRAEYERLLKEAPVEDEADAKFRVQLLKDWQEMVAWHQKKPVDLKPIVQKKWDEIFKRAERIRITLKEQAENGKIPDEQKKQLVETIIDLDKARKLKEGLEGLQGDALVKKQMETLDKNRELFAKLNNSGRALGRVAGRVGVGGGLGSADPFSIEDSADAGGATDSPPELPNQVPLPTPASPAAEVVAGDAFAPAAKKADGGTAKLAEPKIKLQEWNPDTPYLKSLRLAAEQEKPISELEKLYFELKKDYPQNSGFYLDVAQFFAEQKQSDIALRILSTVAELDMENAALLRILAHRYDQLGHYALAELIFREVLALRDYEPQSYRDLALVLEKKGEFQEAADLLWDVSMSVWDNRFGKFQLITLTELNALIAKNEAKVQTEAYDSRFLKNLDCDVRIILTWDADNTDMDLWVTDLLGEQCNYDFNRTSTGGRMSDDITQGYGPEVFMIKKALPGKYNINTEFFGNSQQNLAGETTIQATLITNWGRPSEKRKAITLRLKEEKDVVDIGELEF